VKVRLRGGLVQVRDSKHQDGPVLVFTPAEWKTFMAGSRTASSISRMNGS